MLCPKGKDLANEYLVQFLEGAYLCTQRIQYPESVSVPCFHTKTFSVASSDKLRAWWGTVAKLTRNHHFNLESERCSRQPYNW